VVLACRFGGREVDGSRSVERERRGTRLGHEVVPVEESDGLTVALYRQGPFERRRQAEGHLDLRGVDEGREPPAGVASVGGGERPSEAIRERDLHRPEPS